ncbi:hypothetical protein PRN20_02820 [Devosia sp. ZB163]|uniref:hypothetical protein n=1 Tax=Devosia sp. ZB163 TaxID=3025938 RepID=UPI0023609F99|nr:hypothetical protein [Devosia sp. ZB163]MDC9822656.1 hypothetical protein [Devosia sp. ZB163]
MSGNATASTGRAGAINANLVRNWWIVSLRGLLAIAFGIVALAFQLGMRLGKAKQRVAPVRAS